MSKTPEAKVEQLLKEKAKEYNCLAMKMVSPGVNGVPDQVIMGHTADKTHRVVFVEVKRPGARPRPDQVHTISKMRDNGASVTVIDHEKGVEKFYKLIFGDNSSGDTAVPESFYENDNLSKSKARKLFIPKKES